MTVCVTGATIAATELERAARLLPGRGEAWAALTHLATADDGDTDAWQR